MDDDPMGHLRRAFRAAGWVPQILGNPLWRSTVPAAARSNAHVGVDYLGETTPYAKNDDELRELLRDNILGKGYPVLSIGTLLPPEAGIICGYSRRLDAVYGYHHFQPFPGNAASVGVTLDDRGRYVKTGWTDDTLALIAFHYKTPKPPGATTYREAIQTALRVTTTPGFRGRHAGPAAFRAWSEAIGSAWSDETLRDGQAMRTRLMRHNDAILCLSDGRAAAQAFMREAASVLASHSTPLGRASGLYGEVADLAREMVALQGGPAGDPAVMPRFARQETREKLAGLIGEAARIEEEIARTLAGISASGL
jgi:hypothetical protein